MSDLSATADNTRRPGVIESPRGSLAAPLPCVSTFRSDGRDTLPSITPLGTKADRGAQLHRNLQTLLGLALTIIEPGSDTQDDA